MFKLFPIALVMFFFAPLDCTQALVVMSLVRTATHSPLSLCHLDSAAQKGAVQCSAVQFCAVQCSAVQCTAVHCSAVQFIAV